MFPKGLTQFGEKRATDDALWAQSGCTLLFFAASGWVQFHLLYAFDLNVKSVFCWEGNIMTAEEKKAWAAEQLVLKNNELGRLPKKEDFDVVTLSRIKAFLGPWPRALEAAGLKPVKGSSSSKEKRA